MMGEPTIHFIFHLRKCGLAYVEYSDILNINSSALLLLGGRLSSFILSSISLMYYMMLIPASRTWIFHCKGWLTCSLCNEVPCLQANYKIQFHH